MYGAVEIYVGQIILCVRPALDLHNSHEYISHRNLLLYGIPLHLEGTYNHHYACHSVINILYNQMKGLGV